MKQERAAEGRLCMVPAAPPCSTGLRACSAGLCQLPGKPYGRHRDGIHIPPHQGFQNNVAVPTDPLSIPFCLLPRSLFWRLVCCVTAQGVQGCCLLPCPSQATACWEPGQQIWLSKASLSSLPRACAAADPASATARGHIPPRELGSSIMGSVFCKAGLML